MRTLYICPFFFFPLLSFFLAYSQPSQIGCLPYLHAWCGLSANLECMSEMCCTLLAEIQDAKNRQKFAIWAPSHNFIRLCLCKEGIYRQSEKNLNSNISSTCPHNMANFGPLMDEIGLPVWGTPTNFNGFRVLPSLLQRRRSPQANQTLHDAWPSPGLVHYVYVSGALAPLMQFCPVQNLLYVQILRSPILKTLLHGTPAAGVSQTLRRGTRNRPTELSQSPPPIFGWVAITLASAHILVTFRVIRRPREMCCGHARLCVCLCVCLSVCLSVRGRMPTLLHGPGCNLADW